jgi:hypothetical protein
MTACNTWYARRGEASGGQTAGEQRCCHAWVRRCGGQAVTFSGHDMAPARSRPRVLAVLEGIGPSATLTVVKPLMALHRAGQIVADITLAALCSGRQIDRADVVVFSRNSDRSTLTAVAAAAKPMIYNIDDNPFAAPTYAAWERASTSLHDYECYLQTASLVRVYSEPMRECVRQLNPHVVQVDAPIDWDLVPASPPRRDSTCVRLVYATGRHHLDPFAALFMNDLQQILRLYRGRVEVFFWGYQPAELRKLPAVHCLRFIPDYDRFFHRFTRAGFDIGLAPLHDDVFCRSKTNNKFREYAAARIAGVYSNVDVYSACVEDGQTGLIVSNAAGSWFAAIARLIEDASLRQRIQRQAFAYVRAHYGVEHMQATWLAQIHEVINRARHSSEGVGGGGTALVAAQSAERPPPPAATATARGNPRFLRILREGLQVARLIVTQWRDPRALRTQLHIGAYKYYAILRLRWGLSPVIAALGWNVQGRRRG